MLLTKCISVSRSLTSPCLSIPGGAHLSCFPRGGGCDSQKGNTSENTIFIGIIIETWCPTNVSVRHLAWPSHTVSGINLTKTKACSHSKMYYPKTASFFNLVFFPHSISHDLAWNICLFVCGLSPPPRM